MANRVTGEIALYYMQGVTRLEGVWLSDYVPGNEWQIVGAADYNHDGYVDLYWQHTNGDIAGWRMQGATNLAVDVPVPTAMALPWRIRDVADVNRDGEPDWWIQNSSENKVGVWLLRWDAATQSLQLIDGRLLVPEPGVGYEWKIVGPR